jgi:hypothetical protein
MKKSSFKKTFSYITVFGLVFLASVFLAENSSAKIENSVSATANTGGNVVTNGGTIKTGNAKASVNAQNYVNGSEKVQNKVEARAEVQGGGAEASVEANGEKKSCTSENGETCTVEINKITTNNSGTGENTDAAKVENKNIIRIAVSAISSFTKNITEKIISWFS